MIEALEEKILDWQSKVHEIVLKIVSNLVAKDKTVSTAESCTAGMLSSQLTRLPGSSQIFLGGVASYANEAKAELLNVSMPQIEKHGAVSSQVAESMAANIRELLNSDFGISLTGIAGPEGGTAEKPVGTVWCGIAGPGGVRSLCFDLGAYADEFQGLELREKIRQASCIMAFNELLTEIQHT